MNSITEELGIPNKYIQSTTTSDKFNVLVHNSWLKSLVKYNKLDEFVKKPRYESWLSKDELKSPWQNIFIRVLKKQDAKVIPLPRLRKLPSDDCPLLFPQLMQYISESNNKNLTKEAIKKYTNNNKSQSREKQITLANYNDVLKEIILRIYGCPIVNICDTSSSTEDRSDFDVNLNILPAICCVETLNNFYLLHLPYIEHNLSDCINFSPAILEKCYTKPLFIVYQLLKTLKGLHDRSLTLGDITLNDIYLTEDLWIYVFPKISSNIHVEKQALDNDFKLTKNPAKCAKEGHTFGKELRCNFCGIRTYDKVQVTNESLDKLCELWIDGNISNYTYISALNTLSGRKLGDPNCHHVFPWVTDFSSRCGKSWRDLKKSKYRLNKGDRQLDLTYENTVHQTPHHVSDVLSSITYYVYMARKTPKSVLCKNVRTVWVPAEYPSSIQRMQEWTPDECIPEFFTDPGVFRSIHDDLDDLEVPSWCSSPEDFIEKHREALESQYVSERLHFWIDLTFGFKLSGVASVKAKNVCLHLADEHDYLTKSGVVQLFSHPHPPKSTNLAQHKTTKVRERARERNSPATNMEQSKTDEEDLDDFSNRRSALSLSKFLSRSRSSLNDDPPKMSRSPSGTRSTSLGPSNSTFSLATSSKTKNQLSISNSVSETITLPKDLKPESALESLEKRYSFVSKTFHPEHKYISTEKITEKPLREKASLQNSFTNFMFSENFERKATKSLTFPLDNNLKHLNSNNLNVIQSKKNEIMFNYSEFISARRIQELQTIGCLICEIFMPKQLRAMGANRKDLTFQERLKLCLTVLNSCTNDIPLCVKTVTKLLLQNHNQTLDKITFPPVSDTGLPPPSAHLLLEPLLHSIIPFPKIFPTLHYLVRTLKDFNNISIELDLLYHFDCNGAQCTQYESLEKTKILLAQNIGECKVKACVKILKNILDNINLHTDGEIVDLILPHIRELILSPATTVLTVWYLFDPIARVLGPAKTQVELLDVLLKLFEHEPNESTIPFYGKIAKVYHHSFLLSLMIRLGLKSFLENFITPLVEAVGGYKDYDNVDFTLHTHSEKITRKSHLKTMDCEAVEFCQSSDDSPSDKAINKEDREPQLFEFDEENPDSQLKTLIKRLELNVSSDLPFNHSCAEEALDASLTENIEQLKNLEELTLDLDSTSDKVDHKLMSPTIPIPMSLKNTQNITCLVGSKTSDNSLLQDAANTSNSKRYDTEISVMANDSVIWLSHRLGPVLTARYLSRNLLKMLSLCYVGPENMKYVDGMDLGERNEFTVTSSFVEGDQNASKVLECLASIAGLYGEQLILFQYIPHMSELITLCKRKLTPNLEGGLVSCLALLKYIMPFLSDSTVMDYLQDVILKTIVFPTVRLLGSTKHTFPNGSIARSVLARKFVDTMYVLSIRIGAEMTRTHLTVPALQRFFLIFDKVHANENFNEIRAEDELSIKNDQTFEESHFVSNRKDISTAENQDIINLRKGDDFTPIKDSNFAGDTPNDVINELKSVFTPELAHISYLPFLKHVGLQSMSLSLKNHDTIKDLCREYQRECKNVPDLSPSVSKDNVSKASSSIGSNVALVGNRIDFQEDYDSLNSNLLNIVRTKMENSSRHLRGNWLAYWEHEIGRSEKDTMFNFKQIKLQTFVGHTHSVKSLQILNNENSFMSGSRDKTVKLWSLRSQGDGTSNVSCQWTYTAHKKSVLSLAFVESNRLVVSCDSVVHVWDPFMGANVGHFENPRYAPVNVLKCMPAPSTLVFAATTEGTLKVIDTRTCTYINELKINSNPTGLIRCLGVSPSGSWVATGQSSGSITVLDTRTGLIMSSWRAHESEVLQLVVLDENTLISSSLDQNISVWNVSDGKFKFHLRGSTEPVHCLNIYNSELVSGTTANRIGVHTSIDLDASFSSTKLRSDTFRGLLTSMALLPLNRLLLLGAENGNISLLC